MESSEFKLGSNSSSKETKNDEEWSKMQRQRTKRLLKTSKESGLCGACEIIHESKAFSHHEYTGLRESACNCRVCRLFLDSVSANVRNNPSSEVTITPPNGRLFYKFYGQPGLTFDLLAMNGNLIILFRFFLRMVITICHIGHSTTSDAPLRDIQQDPLSQECINIILSWIETCVSTHNQCITKSPSTKPSRLIEINESYLRGSYLCLRELQDLPATDLRYCALSYCWGSFNHLRTTSENLSRHRKKISTRSLPKTVRDAILVTQNLGIKYLWVDSLCIVQDSAIDWAEECSKMGGYYQSAYLVLSALDSADARDGFLRPRPDINLTVSSADGKLRIRAQPLTRKQTFKRAALNKRGWALQERMLATRILHYSHTELFWECLTCTAREGSVGTMGYQVNSGLIVDSDGDDLKASLYNTGTDPFSIEDGSFSLWYRIVKLYSRKTLSHSSDKMAAVTGLAAMIADKEGAHYNFGLWEQDIHGLTWTRATYIAARLENFPSWSWLSWDGPVNYQIYTEPRMMSRNDAEVVPTGGDLDPRAKNNHLILSALSKKVQCLTESQIEDLMESRAERWISAWSSESHQRWARIYENDFGFNVYDEKRELLGMASIDHYTDQYEHESSDEDSVYTYKSRDEDPEEYLYTAICIGERLCDPIKWSASNQHTIDVATYFLLIYPDTETKHHCKRAGLGVTREIRETSKKESSEMFRGSRRDRFCLV